MGSTSTETLIDINTLFGSMWPLERRDVSLARLKAEMGRFNVNKACTLSAKGIFYDHTLGNDETLRVCSDDPMLIPALTINPNTCFTDVEEIRKRVDEGFRILRLFPEYQGFMIKSAHVRKILAKSESLGIPVMIPVQAGIPNVLELIMKIRGLRVVLTGVRYFDLAEILSSMDESDNLYIETRLLNSPDGISTIVEEFGADRLVFGSGAPLGYIGSSLNIVQLASISESDKRIILSGSAEKLVEG